MFMWAYELGIGNKWDSVLGNKLGTSQSLVTLYAIMCLSYLFFNCQTIFEPF